MGVNRILLNPFLLLGVVTGAPLIASILGQLPLMVWVQILVVALTVFAVWVGLSSSGQ